MAEHIFTLRYRLPPSMTCSEAVEVLGRAGCDHMLLGIGVPGHLAACVSADAPTSPENVERFARLQIESAIPDIVFLDVRPGYAECTHATCND